MARDEDLFADPAVGKGKSNQYEIDLSSLPKNAPEAESGPEDPEWDLNATEVPNRNRRDNYANQEPVEERPRRPQQNRMDRGEDDSRNPDPRDRRRGGRPEPTFDEVDSDEEMLDDDDVMDDSGDKPKSRFSLPEKYQFNALKTQFMELDKKKKILVGGASIALLIIVIIIIVSVIGSITGGSKDKAPDKPTVTTSQPSKSSAPKPSKSTVAADWTPLLTTSVGKFGTTVDGMQMTAQSIKCDVAAKDMNGASVKASNGAWCQLDFTAKNVSGSILTLSTQRFSIISEANKSYNGNSQYGDVGGSNVISKLAADESVTGTVYFDVPVNTVVTDIKMATFGNGGSPIVVKVASEPTVSPSATPSTPATAEPNPTATSEAPVATTPPTSDTPKSSNCEGLFSLCDNQ
jgi:hypothetical protein